ncbi:MAG TPA: carboxypeptidase regulatory-like domain-containing protein [Geomonas sp.]|nr:carboxypeptidase regulatory-like domain-containing protein [Geomonas sp.]
MTKQCMASIFKHVSLLTVLLLGMVMFGCDGDKGDRGIPGVSTGTLAGTVTNSVTNTPVAGATISVTPSIEGMSKVTTDANGHYAVILPLSAYTVSASAPNYTASASSTVGVFAGQVTTKDFKLVPVANAVVSVAAVSNAQPGQSVTLTAVPAILNGNTTPPSFHWVQVSGPPVASFTNVSSASPTIVLGDRLGYKQALAVVEAPRQSVDPDTETPIFSPLNRTQVLGLTNEALVTGSEATFQVTMTAGSDVTTAPSTVTIKPLFAPQLSVRNVPIGQPVLLQGKKYTNNVGSSSTVPVLQTSWNWSMTAPTGSAAVLNDPTTVNPDFMPDVPGVYTLTENVSGQNLKIYAGTWVGTITTLDANGDPTADPSAASANPGVPGCACHYSSSDAENGKFTRSWNLSGHSHIVSGLTAHLPGGPTVQNITDPHGHWTPKACGPCHTVGFAQYSSPIKANGFSEIYRLERLQIVNGPNAWTDTVRNYPQSASLMQISCQNCHGPTGSAGHMTVGTPPSPTTGPDFYARVSYSSDVCGVCHGEPTRHGKWQQWRSSGHGDFETAMYEGITNVSPTSLGNINAGCGGCHTGQGFGFFNSQLQSGLASRTLNATSLANPQLLPANLNLDTVQPQVCVTCHSPHNPGTKSGLTGSIVRLAGYDPTYGTTWVGTTPLLPAGYQAAGVGNGALCIVCHETRNGEPVSGQGNPTLHEDGDLNFDPSLDINATAATAATLRPVTSYAGPHEAAQGDVLMGRNGYFVKGVRSPHSTIADTCVNCHMELMPAPQDLDPARLGTNHNFAVDLDVANICANCHAFSGQQIQDSFNSQYQQMIIAIQNKLYYIKTYSLSGGTAPHMPAQDGATVVFTPGRIPTISVTGSSNTAANTTGTVNLNTYLAGVTYKGITYNQSTTSGSVAPLPLPANTGYNGIIPVIYKANWNAALVANDASQGIHNPRFSNDIMQETTIQVSVF